MSERGVFGVDRGIWDHPLLVGAEFSRREVWLWLLSEAAWKARRVRVGSLSLDLQRGELAHSLRFMAEKWGWTEPRVRRFLGCLKTDAMIETTTDAGITVISICNYARYQRVSMPSDAPTDAPSDAATTQQRRKEEDIKTIEVVSEAKASAAPAAPVYSDSRHELWGEGVAILGQLGVPEKAARDNIGRWLKSVADDCSTLLGAIQRARENNVINPIPWVTKALRSRGPPRKGRGFLDIHLDLTRDINDRADQDLTELPLTGTVG